jgi:hypothetical protein
VAGPALPRRRHGALLETNRGLVCSADHPPRAGAHGVSMAVRAKRPRGPLIHSMKAGVSHVGFPNQTGFGVGNFYRTLGLIG